MKERYHWSAKSALAGLAMFCASPGLAQSAGNGDSTTQPPANSGGATTTDTSSTDSQTQTTASPNAICCDGGGGGGDGGGGGSSDPYDIVPAKAYTMSPTGVNLSDGAFTYTVTDLTIGTLSLDRFYSGPITGPDPNDMFYGQRTTNTFDIYVNPLFGKANPPFSPQHVKPTVHMGLTAVGPYSQTQLTGTVADFPAESLDAFSGELALLNSAYVFTDKQGAIYTFNPSVQVSGSQGTGVYATNSQRISSIKYPDGRLRTFTYVNTELKMVSDSTGYAIIFDYVDYYDSFLQRTRHLISDACGFDLSRNYVASSSICSGSSLKVNYTYSNGLLTGVTNVFAQTTTYQYAYNGAVAYISCIKPPGAAVCQISNYYPNSQQLTQTLADGEVWTFYWGTETGLESNDIPVVDGYNDGAVVNAAGTRGLSFTGTSPYRDIDQNGNVTKFLYSGGIDFDTINPPPIHFGSRLDSVTLPEGSQYIFNNTGPFNAVRSVTIKAKPGSGLADQVKTYGYANRSLQSIAEPTSIVDPEGHETDFTYADWGGKLSELDPAPSVGAARPLKLYTYIQKYAYIKNSGGMLVQASAPVWLPATATVCQTVAGSNSLACDTGAPTETTTYQYGADGTVDNLLLRSELVTADGVIRRTCYAYDQWNNKISETKPDAGLASCS